MLRFVLADRERYQLGARTSQPLQRRNPPSQVLANPQMDQLAPAVAVGFVLVAVSTAAQRPVSAHTGPCR